MTAPSSAHLPAHVLEELAEAYGADLSQAQASRPHLAACTQCRAELELLAADIAHFRRIVLPRTLPAIEERASRGRLWFFLALPALAAAVLALAVLPASDEAPEDDGVTAKGPALLRLYARRGDRFVSLPDGASLGPGEEIRFVVIPGGSPYLVVASVDGAGKANLYFPAEEPASRRIEPLVRLDLPDSIVLDETPGPERVFALLSSVPLRVTDVSAALEQLGATGADGIRAAHLLPVAAEDQATVLFEKRPADAP